MEKCSIADSIRYEDYRELLKDTEGGVDSSSLTGYFCTDISKSDDLVF